MSWVLLSVLWLMVHTQAMVIKQTPDLKFQEIVYPKRLDMSPSGGMENNHTKSQDKEERYAPEVQYQIILNGEEIILQLQKTTCLLGPDYTEAQYPSAEEEISRSYQSMKHCCYEGHILNEKDSTASISTCDGLRGHFTHHGQGYLIQPGKSTERREHVVSMYNQEEPDTAKRTCGLRTVGRRQGHFRAPRSLNSSEQEEFLQARKYINLFLVLDHAFYKIHKGNVTLMRSFVFNVLNLLNVIYNTIDVHVALVGMEIWSDNDKIEVVPNIGTTFNNFVKWYRANLGKKKTHNHAQLLSGISYHNRRVGMAASDSFCSPASVAVIEAKRKNNVTLAGLMSHELGHALGMPDIPYTTQCPSGSCVMGQYLTSKFPKDFSTTCRSYFQKYLLSQKPKCLLQAPVPKNIITEPVCGNQLLEVGEGCDCGSPKECSNSCCEPLTCQLKPGRQCRGKTASRDTE